MTIYDSGPINIQQGNSANFVIEFLSSTAALTVPSSGSLSISYTNLSNVVTSESFDLTEDNSFFTCTWSSTSAALGLATWTVVAASTVAQSQGQIRVIQRASTY